MMRRAQRSSVARARLHPLRYLSGLNFSPGQTRKTIDVTVCPAIIPGGGEEQFTVELSQLEGARFGDTRGVGTILPGDCFGHDRDDVTDGELSKLWRDAASAW
jgi:hypothetical protein